MEKQPEKPKKVQLISSDVTTIEYIDEVDISVDTNKDYPFKITNSGAAASFSTSGDNPTVTINNSGSNIGTTITNGSIRIMGDSKRLFSKIFEQNMFQTYTTTTDGFVNVRFIRSTETKIGTLVLSSKEISAQASLDNTGDVNLMIPVKKGNDFNLSLVLQNKGRALMACWFTPLGEGEATKLKNNGINRTKIKNIKRNSSVVQRDSNCKDIKVKMNFITENTIKLDIENSLSSICNLTPRAYIDEYSQTQHVLCPKEVHKVISNAAIVIDKEAIKDEAGITDKVNSIDPTVILINAVAAIKALSQKNEKLEKDISMLKKQLSL